MKKNPCHVSFVRSVNGYKAPIVGVFLLISLVIDQPLLAAELTGSFSEASPAPTVSGISADQSLPVDQKSPVDQKPPVDGTAVDPKPSGDASTDPVSIAPSADSQINPLADPLISPAPEDQIIDPTKPEKIDPTLSEEQTAQLKELDDLLAAGQIEPDEYSFKKGVILGNISPADPKDITSPLNISWVDPKSQTLGKYLSPEVSAVDGSLNYVYPISVPPGRAGLNPNLALVYDSSNPSQDSIVGLGWALNIPYIKRVNKKGTDKIYNDSDGSFLSSLDGELVNQGQGVFTPRTENGRFIRYVFSGNSWTLTDKQGTQYRFGLSDNSRQDNSDHTKVFAWLLDKVTDTNGNTISYAYFKDLGQIYPQSIVYNQNETFRVEFSYAARAHANTSYAAAFRITTALRLSEISIKIDGNLATKYIVSASDNLVQSVQVVGYQGGQASLPPLTFKNFTDEGTSTLGYDAGFAWPIDPATGKVIVVDYNNFAYYGNSLKDINGDGLLDIVRWTVNQPNGYATQVSGNQIFINTGQGFKLKNSAWPTDPATNKVLVLDYKSCQAGQSPSSYYGNSFIDINGDGLLDIVRWAASKPRGYSSFLNGNQVFINTGTDFVLDPGFTSSLPADANGNVLVLDCNNVDYYGNSFKDVNGDGRPDIVRWNSSKPRGYSSALSGNQVFINTGTGFVLDSGFTNSLPTSPTNRNVLTLDYKYSNNTTNFYGNSFMDINGDGLLDIVRWTGGKLNGYYSSPLNNSGNQIFLNTGSGFVLAPDFLLPADASGKVFALDYNYGAVATYYGNSFKDINGDGLLDVVRWLAGSPNGYFKPNYTSGNQIFLNTGTGFALDSGYNLPADPATGNVFVLDYSYNNFYGNSFKDINGDGLLDVVRWDLKHGNGYSSSLSGNQVFINTGAGFATSSFFMPTAPSGNVLALEYNIPSTSYSPYGISFQDINGDGLLDVVRWDASQGNGPPADVLRGNQMLLGAIGRPAVKRIINRFGGEEVFSFKGIRQFTDSQDNGLNTRLPKGYQPFVVVARLVNDKSGTGNMGTTTYEYQGADYFNPYDKPFDKKIAGFSKVIETGPSGAIVTTKYHQGNGQTGDEPADSYARISKPYEVTVQNKGGDLYSRARLEYSENDLGGLAKSVQLASRLAQTYDGHATSHRDTAENYAYDQYGNLTQKISFGEVVGQANGSFSDIGTDTLAEYIDYASSSANYLVGRPSRDAVFDKDSNKVRETKMYYDNLPLGVIKIGNQTKTENWKADAAYVSTQRAYDSYGLVGTSTDERGNDTIYAYDQYDLYPETITNSLGQIVRFPSYDYLTGQAKQTIDQNGFRYQTEFDAFGRVLKQWIPDPNSNATNTRVLKTEYRYVDQPLKTSVRKMAYQDSNNIVDDYQYFDGFDRLIQERRAAEDAGNFNVRDLAYDQTGALQKESLMYASSGSAQTGPTSISSLYINHVYDLLGRPIKIIDSVGLTTTAYDNWKITTTDARGKTKDYYKDAYGNLVKVEEHNGGDTYTTRYGWNGNQKLTRIIDALANVRNFDYDGLGRRLRAEDLHLPGASAVDWKYTYDNAGNLIKTVSPKGDEVNYDYDALNRLFREYTTDPADPQFFYRYDNALLSCTNAKGRLCAVQKGTQDDANYQYNSNGALATENKYIDGLKYATSYTYDYQGNILTITYPDNSVVRYTYNKAGLPEKIEKADGGGAFSDVIANFDYSPIGQVTLQQGGNGTLSTTKTYAADQLYRLVNQKVINSHQLTLQDLTYIYDQTGNIVRVIDAANTKTRKTVDYTYDDLNRLKTASSTNVVSGKPYSQFFTYDPLGNILFQSRNVYSYSGANPQAVTRISNQVSHVQDFSYDANGNLINKTTTAIVATLNAAVNPNHGTSTMAGFSVGNLENIGNGGSPVALTPYVISDLLPNSHPTYNVVAHNADGDDLSGENSITLSTSGGPAPTILAAWVSSIGDQNASFGGQVNPNGRSTKAWYELTGGQGAGQYGFKYIEDCNTPEELPSIGVAPLATSTNYQVRVVAVNDRGTSTSGWLSFRTKRKPDSDPLHAPSLASATVNPETPLYLLDNVDYSWNYKNQLSGVSNSVSTSTYGYDYASQRVKAAVYEKSTNKTYTTYYPNRFYEISQAASAPDQEKKYIYAGNTLVATIKKTGATGTPDIAYVYGDNLGSASVIADSAGNPQQAIDYYPFGQERLCGGPLSGTSSVSDLSCDAERKYIGEYYDTDTALNYLNARYYDSFIGRFISQDPMYWSPEKVLNDPQSLNAYSYARNNPIVNKDPSGKYVGVDDAVVLLVGGVAGVLFEVGVDLATGQKITAGKVVGSFVGGALLGGAALYAPVTGGASLVAYSVAAGALSAGVGNVVEQGIDLSTGEREGEFNTGEFTVVAAVGGVSGAAGLSSLSKIEVAGITNEAGNAAAGQIGDMSAGTAIKWAVASETSGALMSIADTLVQNSVSSDSFSEGISSYYSNYPSAPALPSPPQNSSIYKPLSLPKLPPFPQNTALNMSSLFN